MRRQSPPPSASPLTVGARALAKHTHRDVSGSWWGPCTGSELEKNAAALLVLSRILAGVVWINLHHMPPRKNVLEVRVEQVRARQQAGSTFTATWPNSRCAAGDCSLVLTCLTALVVP